MQMERCTTAPQVDPGLIRAFFADCAAAGADLHTLLIEKDGELLVRAAKMPYSCADVREVYSVTKSFTSVAIGTLWDDGLLSFEERLCDIFPESVPQEPCQEALAVRVCDLLSMQAGQPACSMAQVEYAANPVSTFFAQPFDRMPGTYMVYNTACSCMLGEIVRKKTGEELFDYLTRRVFAPLGITNVRMNTTCSGASEAGAGLQISADDLLKFGEMLLGGGLYRGRRIVSEAYLHMASTVHADTSGRWDNADANAGYCWHFWKNSVGGYRADGSDGQFVLVFPEQHTVAVLQSYTPQVQVLLDRIYALLPRLLCAKGDRSAPMPTEPVPDAGTITLQSGVYRLQQNPCGFTQLTLSRQEDAVCLTFSDGTALQSLQAGCGCFKISESTAPYYRPKLYPILRHSVIEKTVTAACCEQTEQGLVLHLYHKSCPHPARMMVQTDAKKLTITMDANGRFDPSACELHGTWIAPC